MRIDALIHSCNYADMLAITLPLNKPSYDSITVYTKFGDEATKEVCRVNDVECVETHGFTHNGASFNRGRVFNEAFQRIVGEWRVRRRDLGWVETLDADIIKPSGWRAVFEALPPDIECFYGSRRYNVETQEQWGKVKADPEYLKQLILFRGYAYSYSAIFNMGSTTFTRLWKETWGNPYMEFHDGSEADWRFRNNWGDHPWNPAPLPPDNILDHSVLGLVDPPTGLLRQLPFNIIHLGVTGFNSKERITPLWIPNPPSS